MRHYSISVPDTRAKFFEELLSSMTFVIYKEVTPERAMIERNTMKTNEEILTQKQLSEKYEKSMKEIRKALDTIDKRRK